MNTMLGFVLEIENEGKSIFAVETYFAGAQIGSAIALSYSSAIDSIYDERDDFCEENGIAESDVFIRFFDALPAGGAFEKSTGKVFLTLRDAVEHFRCK